MAEKPNFIRVVSGFRHHLTGYSEFYLDQSVQPKNADPLKHTIHVGVNPSPYVGHDVLFSHLVSLAKIVAARHDFQSKVGEMRGGYIPVTFFLKPSNE